MSTAIQSTGKRSRILNSGACTLAILLLIFAHPGNGQRGNESRASLHMPTLNTLRTATLGPPYSCHHDLAEGYGSTALFLSEHSRSRPNPELLFNGACGATDVFDVNTGGDDMSLIADLGTIPLASVTAHQVFNFRNVNTPDDYTKFTRVANVVEGHTYAVVINHEDVRGLVVFKVMKLIPDEQVTLEYEVNDYQINVGYQRFSGFDWTK